MGRCRIVRPNSMRLPISDGDYIDVKKELNAGESRQVYAGMVKEQKFGEAPTADPARVGLTKMLQYLLGWSLVDLKDEPLELSEAALLSLDLPTYNEINAAIDTHAEKVEADREARKNSQATESASSPTSISAA